MSDRPFELPSERPPARRVFRGSVPPLALLFLAASGAHAQAPADARQDARSRLLVTADWVADRLGDPGLVLIHVGDEDDYRAEHIPGAHYASHRAISHPSSHGDGPLILELPEPSVLQETLRGWGVDDDSRIVVYWGSEWVTPTARVVFTLAWAGLADNTVLLDGGIDAWKAAGHPVTDVVPPAGAGSVTVRAQNDLVVDAAWVQAHAGEPQYALLDGRPAAFYDGVREDRGKAGHIPGAGSVPWTELIDESLHLRSPAELTALFAAAGVEPGKRLVVYCHIGQYATLVIFAARTLGYDAVLYDGAFQDWAQRDLPVESASSGGP